MSFERMTPPGSNVESSAPIAQAPVLIDRGFLVEPGGDLETETRWNNYLEAYQGRFIVPTDEFGLPYCIAPRESKFTRKYPPQPDEPKYDLNHQFGKYAVALEANPSLDATAKHVLINSRGQEMDFAQHHYVYHPQMWGPRTPQTKVELLGVLLLSSAGYIGENALDLSSGEVEVIRLSKRERKWLWTSGQVRVLDDGAVSNYIRDHVFDIETDHLQQRDVETFLYTFDRDEKIKLGLEIASKLVERAVEPIEADYTAARNTEVLTFARVGAQKQSLPPRAADFALLKLIHGKRVKPVLGALHDHLAQKERRPFSEYFVEREALRAAV